MDRVSPVAERSSAVFRSRWRIELRSADGSTTRPHAAARKLDVRRSNYQSSFIHRLNQLRYFLQGAAPFSFVVRF